MGSYAGQAPGLDYPRPSEAQLRWLESDVLDDLKDLAGEGEGDVIRRWDVAVEQVSVDDPAPQPANASLDVSQLWMRVDVAVHIGRSANVSVSQVVDLWRRRGMSAGMVADRVSSTLSGGREGSWGGTWLLAVDGSSVRSDVELPCLGYARVSWSRDCDLSVSAWWSRGSSLVQVCVVSVWGVLGSIVVCVYVCQRMKYGSIRLSVLSDWAIVVRVCHGVSRVGLHVVSACILMQCGFGWEGAIMFAVLLGLGVLRLCLI